jgi:hypothetical protein
MLCQKAGRFRAVKEDVPFGPHHEIGMPLAAAFNRPEMEQLRR